MGCYPAYTEKLRWSDQTIQVHFFKDVSMLCYLPHFSSKRKRKGSLCECFKEKGLTLRRLQIGNDKCDTTSLAKLGYASSFCATHLSDI
ncbi:hypothetical protein Pint_07263 [Pistacia integerrima]|uniref:Uncharacterized protein n=1 Tax=Pistacia integerrima TaxID=434235 RepID=A0ACC0XTN4_9ROSI|nr:hypothetical protein Pint_07263 [Pistacia integerrima]